MADLNTLLDKASSATGQFLESPSQPGQAAYQSTRVLASFHSDDGFDGAVDNTPREEKDQPFRIVGLTTQKAFGGNPGTWTLTVKRRGRIDPMRLWHDPEDTWVRIVVLKNGRPTEVLFGPMNTITEDMQRGGQGERAETYSLSGFDFHKVFSTTQLYINIHENAGALPIIPMYDAISENLIGSPDEILNSVLIAWLGNNGVADKQWEIPQSLGGGSFFDMLVRDFQECRGKIFDPALYSPDQMMGKTLWQTLEEYANGMLNELFTSIKEDAPFDPNVPPRPRLVLRERPFPSKDKGHRSWEDLPTHALTPGLIQRRQVTRGAPESRFNYWLLDAKGLVGDGLGVQLQIQQAAQREKGIPGSAPIYDLDDIRLHGFRKFHQSTRYFPFREDPTWFSHAARWLHLLHDWYAVSRYELNGTLTLSQIMPQIRIGQRVVEKRADGDDVTYYVEGVSHSWQFPGAGSTTLNVTRGEYADEDLLELAYERYIVSPTNALSASTIALLNDVIGEGSVSDDELLGQPEPPEKKYLRNRGKIDDQQAIDRGEPQSAQGSKRPNLRPDDLPDQQVGQTNEELTGTAKPRERKQGGNLTRRELEAGKPLPVRERNVGNPDSGEESADEFRERNRGAPTRKGGRR